MKKALIVAGGWPGHDPEGVSKLFSEILREENFECDVSFSLDAYADREKIKSYDLIIPHWTTGHLGPDQLEGVLDAIASGVGIAGCHAGLADAFHDNPDWQWMAGSQLVSHPGGTKVKYMVNIHKNSSIITEGIEDFSVESEFYYLHVDPCVNVLASIHYPVGDGPFKTDDYVIITRDKPGFEQGDWYLKDEYQKHNPHYGNTPSHIPAIYTKSFGKGKVFYCALGHNSEMLSKEPLKTIIRRGFLWASR